VEQDAIISKNLLKLDGYVIFHSQKSLRNFLNALEVLVDISSATQKAAHIRMMYRRSGGKLEITSVPRK
jgi:hypothetical protein